MTLFEQTAPWIMRGLMEDFPTLTASDAAAIVGNLGHESNGFATLQETKPTVAGSKGGYGWAQWTGSRRRDFEAWCAKRNLKPSSDEANYGFLVEELRTTEAKAIPAVRAAGTLYDKVVAFERAFERAGVKHYDSRLAYAKRALAVFTEPPAPDLPDVPDEPQPKEPSTMNTIITSLILSALRHGLTALAGVLVAYGVIEQGQSDNFIVILLGIASYAIGQGASLIKNAKN